MWLRRARRSNDGTSTRTHPPDAHAYDTTERERERERREARNLMGILPCFVADLASWRPCGCTCNAQRRAQIA
eukprot:scaffold2718_cov248-Pinguiococcus_pyrenoidosus.AAC.2